MHSSSCRKCVYPWLPLRNFLLPKGVTSFKSTPLSKNCLIQWFANEGETSLVPLSLGWTTNALSNIHSTTWVNWACFSFLFFFSFLVSATFSLAPCPFPAPLSNSVDSYLTLLVLSGCTAPAQSVSRELRQMSDVSCAFVSNPVAFSRQEDTCYTQPPQWTP